MMGVKVLVEKSGITKVITVGSREHGCAFNISPFISDIAMPYPNTITYLFITSMNFKAFEGDLWFVQEGHRIVERH